MGNTVGTLSGTLVAMRVLETLLARFPILSQISTDFSAFNALFNQTVQSRVVTPTVAQDYSAANGYTIDDRTTVDIPIVINKHKSVAYKVTDTERSSTNRNLVQEWADTGAYALGKAMVQDLLALVLNASFPLSQTFAANDFDRKAVVKLREVLNANFVPDMNRFLLLKTSHNAALSNDITIVASLYNREANAIADGAIPRVHGFGLSEYAELPDNAENLAGIAGNKESLLIATRVPDLPNEGSVFVPANIQNVTEPNSGLTVQLRQWYDPKLGHEYWLITLMYGVAVGLSEANACKRLVRIKSA